jgi:predicted DNA-binding protein (UPF0251 family)
MADLRRALTQITPEQREALILVGAGGLSYEEAAKVCGCAVGTVKSRVARARQALERMLNGPDGDKLRIAATSRSEAATTSSKRHVSAQVLAVRIRTANLRRCVAGSFLR